MKAYPYHSKFYSTYWDVFKDYAEQQFSQSNSSLVQLNEKVQYLNLLNSKNKTLKQDIFIYFRIVGAAFRVHLQSIECLKYLAITNLVLEVYCKTEDETNLLPIQIRMMGEKLKGNSMNGKIPSLIRNKMREYSHNIEHILEKYKH